MEEIKIKRDEIIDKIKASEEDEIKGLNESIAEGRLTGAERHAERLAFLSYIRKSFMTADLAAFKTEDLNFLASSNDLCRDLIDRLKGSAEYKALIKSVMPHIESYAGIAA